MIGVIIWFIVFLLLGLNVAFTIWYLGGDRPEREPVKTPANRCWDGIQADRMMRLSPEELRNLGPHVEWWNQQRELCGLPPQFHEVGGKRGPVPTKKKKSPYADMAQLLRET